MNSGLGKLVLVTGLALAGLAIASMDRDDGTPEERGRLFAAELADAINDVTALTIATADGSFTLEREAADWTLADWGGYPAEFETIKETLVGLAGLEIVEAKTAKAANHVKLGLAAPDAPDSGSLRLTVRGAGDAVLADVIVGDSRPGQIEQLYVRHADEDQTWLVAGKLSPGRDASGWVDKQLLRLPADGMVAVTIEHADGERVAARKEPSGNWTLEAVPEGQRVSSTAGFSALAGALAWVDMEAVVPDAEVPAEAEWTTTTFEREDGFVLTARVTRDDDRALVRFAASQVEPRPPTEEPAPTDEPLEGDGGAADDAADDAAALEATRAAVADEVAELNTRLEPWTFQLSTWKADALTRRLADYVEDIPAPEPEASEVEVLSDDEEMQAEVDLKDSEPLPAPEGDGPVEPASEGAPPAAAEPVVSGLHADDEPGELEGLLPSATPPDSAGDDDGDVNDGG